jgi:salicylate 5-hydroxylase small subunit
LARVLVEEGMYRLQPRGNFDRGLPLCLLALESKNMTRDRVYSVNEMLFDDPYHQRRIVGTPWLVAVERDSVYGERVTSGGLKYQSRLCVYDSEMIASAVIYPL